MRMIFLGSGLFGYPSLKRLSESAHEVLEVITQPGRPGGRGKKIIHTPIANAAKELALTVHEAANVNAPETVDHIRLLAPELLVVIAFGQKIGAELLNMEGCRVINLHGSLLPAYRGAAPINWAIIKGEKRAGVTVIELNDVWDGGAMLAQASTEIRHCETAGELHDRLSELGPDLLLEVISKIQNGSDKPLAQDASAVSKAPKLRKADAAIKWDRPAKDVCNHILGMWPWPGAYCQLQQANSDKIERVTIARAEVIAAVGQEQGFEPGTLTDDFGAVCKDGILRLIEVRPDNSRLMAFADFVNGRRLKAGDRFLDG